LSASAAYAAEAPQVSSTWASEVKATSADVHGLINPGGLLTVARTEYLAEAAYQANLGASPPRDGFFGAAKAPAGTPTPVGSGSTDLAYLQHLSGLKPSTTYRYRIVATNSVTTTFGPARVLTSGETAPVFALPDSRGWEMVSPVDKNGGAIRGPEANFGGGAFQAAAQGGMVTYTAAASFDAPAGSPGVSQYLALRGPDGWSTENLSVPQISAGYDAFPGAGAPYRLFSGDLAAALLSNGRRCRGEGQDCPVANPPLPGSGAPAGYRNYYLRDGSGGFRALLDDAAIGYSTLGPEGFEVTLVAASPDLSQIVLSSCAALAPGAVEIPGPPGECEASATNLYRWSAAGLALINLAPGATLAAQGGALSADGSRVYWSAAGNFYLREGARVEQVDESLGGGGVFQVASANGSVAFFTKAGHLYRYGTVSKAAADLTPGGEVQGVLGASEDGSHVYYLTANGLFLWDDGATVPVAAAADAGNYPPATGTARVSADGSHLAFLSSASLTGYDSNGESEVFLYDAGAAGLSCASCNPSGARPLGPSTIPGAVANGSSLRAYKPRALSADGSRLFFDSSDALAPQDTNADLDVYQWERQGSGSCAKPGGCISLISSGRSEGGAAFIDANADGSDAYFTTDASLVPSDPGAVDLYDARVGGGFPIPPTPIPCVGDACQPLPGEPEDPAPGTLLQSGGNGPVSFPGGGNATRKTHKKRHHKKHRQANRRAGHGRGAK
jgi:hypothetical protein